VHAAGSGINCNDFTYSNKITPVGRLLEGEPLSVQTKNIMSDYRFFTSESVSEGHPDKVADQISDTILDTMLTDDPDARVACETLIKTGMVLIAGEFRSQAAPPDFEKSIRRVLHEIGYSGRSSQFDTGFDGNTCMLINALGPQSENIATGVDKDRQEILGAGDQGVMFGYATDETETLMPAPIDMAHRLMRKHAEIRKKYPWLLGPDAKTQVTFRYRDDHPVAAEEIVLSTHHAPCRTIHNGTRIDTDLVESLVRDEIIHPILNRKKQDFQPNILVNPAGPFEIGGPVADCGLTGRKIMVDTYGGAARHGGGAFSGKDPSKTDRSAAYMARYMAKNIVAAGLASRCEIQLSYAIGKHEPRSVHVETFGSGRLKDDYLEEHIQKLFRLTPHGMIDTLQLKQPFYRQTASGGHFGRKDPEFGFTWEKIDRTAELQQLL